MRHSNSGPCAGRQRGIALVVVLVLLLVMTMIAVVATRTTTVDLKMTTNTVLTRRAFQSSEGSRTAISRILSAHAYYGGWPTSIGGTVTATENFPMPPEVTVVDPLSNYILATNRTLLDVGPPKFKRDPDIRFKLDSNNDGIADNTDMFGEIWVTYKGKGPLQGTSTAQNAADAGIGKSSAQAGSQDFLDVRARGTAPGNATMITGADFRALIQ